MLWIDVSVMFSVVEFAGFVVLNIVKLNESLLFVVSLVIFIVGDSVLQRFGAMVELLTDRIISLLSVVYQDLRN